MGIEKKYKILFVGSFAKDKVTGGTNYASRALIESTLINKVEWILLDTTMEINFKRTFLKRLIGATKRIILFVYYLLFSKPHFVMIFTTHGWGFIEKGIMSLFASMLAKPVILRPSSGLAVNDIKSAFFSRFYSIVIKRCSIIICQSTYWKNFYYKLDTANPDKFVIIPNWINLKNYLDIGYKNSFLRQRTTLNILYLGWVNEEKGIFDAIDAIYMIKEYDINFIVAGDGIGMKQAKERVSSFEIEDKVNFLGWVTENDKKNLLSEVDIYLHPSHFEGFPNSLVEIMAASLPCVATSVGAIQDIINDGVDGFLVPVNQPNVMAERIKFLIENPSLRFNFGLAARNNVQKNNSIENAVLAFDSIFEKLLLN